MKKIFIFPMIVIIVGIIIAVAVSLWGLAATVVGGWIAFKRHLSNNIKLPLSIGGR